MLNRTRSLRHLLALLSYLTLQSISAFAIGEPEVGVQQPSGTDLTAGASIVDFGSAMTNRPAAALTFTITNSGTADLTSLAVSNNGTNAADFAVSALSTTTVPAGTSTTFTVTFTPSGLGTRTATLHIASNDSDENPFDVSLTGFGSNAGTVDTAFNPDPNNVVYGTANQPDGVLIMVGQFTGLGGGRSFMASFNPDGSMQPGAFLDPSPSADFRGVVLPGDGKILVNGSFAGLQSHGAGPLIFNNIVRFLEPKKFDEPFNPNANGVVECQALQSDGQLIIGGAFTTLQPKTNPSPTIRNHLARLTSVGQLDLGFDPNVNGTVNCVSIQPDGKILVGGAFSTLQPNGAPNPTNRANLARLNADGTLDDTFNPAANSPVYCFALQTDGKILVGGSFTSLAATPRNYIGRLNSDGSIDSGFNPNASQLVQSMVVQVDGRIIIGGSFTSLTPNGATNAITRQRVARLNPDGTLDPVFNPGMDNAVNAVMIENDGKIDVGGLFHTAQPNGGPAVTRNFFTRLNNDRADQTLLMLDSTELKWLRSGSTPQVLSARMEMSLDGGTTWSSLGNATAISGGWDLSGLNLPVRCRLRAVGRTFGGRNNSSSGFAATPFTYGYTSPTDLNLDNYSVAEDSPAGTSVGNFTATDADTINDGAIYTLVPGAGSADNASFTIVGTNLQTTTASFDFETKSSYSIRVRVTDFGGLYFEKQLTINVADVVEFPRLRVNQVSEVFSGISTVDFGSAGPSNPVELGFTIINDDYGVMTNVNLTFDGPDAGLFSVVTVPSSTLGAYSTTPASIRFTPTAGGPKSAVLHISSNDTNHNPFNVNLIGNGYNIDMVDTNFNPMPNSAVNTVMTQPDGKIVIGGFFSTLGDAATPHGRVARFNGDGTLDSVFDPNPNSIITPVSLQPDGKIIFGGSFTTVRPNGAPTATTRNRVARVNFDGTLDTSFDPKANNSISSIAIQPDGKIIIGGSFTTVQPNGAAIATSRSRVARVNADGTLDTSFDPSPNSTITSVVIQPDGKVLLGGGFTSLQPNGAGSATVRNRIARVNADGSLDADFDPNANANVNCFALQADGKIIIGGSFTALQPNGATDPILRNYVARLNTDGSVDSSFDPNLSSLVSTIAIQTDGKIIIGGLFTTVQPNRSESAITRNRIARLNSDGTLDATFDPDANLNVTGVTLQEDGSVLMVGVFTAVASVQNTRVARLHNQPATQSLTVPNSNSVQWLRGGSSPETQVVTFEVSTDNGTNWTSLGRGARISGGWNLTGLSLPSQGMIRARAQIVGGDFNGSSGMVEKIASFSFNNAPTDISFSNSTVAENQTSGTTVGSLSATDSDAGDTTTFTLVSGTGSDDNGSFAISGTNFLTAASFDFETKSSYSVRVRVTDAGSLFYEKSFTINVTNVNETPTDITLSNSSIAENQPAGTTVGNFTATDPDTGDTATFSLVSGTGSDDNASFTISGTNLQTAASFDYETKSSYTIRVRATDAGGLFVEKSFTINVTNVNEGPTLSTANSSLTGIVGLALVNSGTFADPDGNGIVTLTADIGTISQTNVSGTWGWTFTPDTIATNPVTVTITATDNGNPVLTTTNSFTLAVFPRPTLQINLVPDVSLRVLGPTNLIYHIQSTDILGTNWESIGTTSIGASGLQEFHDLPSTNTATYYRVAQ